MFESVLKLNILNILCCVSCFGRIEVGEEEESTQGKLEPVRPNHVPPDCESGM